MSNIIPFDGAALPSYLAAIDPATLNGDLTSHASGGFPVISIKGKVFAIVRDGERAIIPNPKDPDSAASSIEMVIIKANKGTSKIWYAAGYQEGAEALKPDCFSNDGTRPDPSAEKPQSKTCALCPKNAWGSKISDVGGKPSKGKACSDSVRIAVATPDALNDPYLIRVPAASIRNLGEFGKMLQKKGVSYQMVVTKIGFDMEAATPLLTFKATGFLPENSFKEVQEMAVSDTVQNILASGLVEPAAATDDNNNEQLEQAAPVVTAEATIAKAKAVIPKIASKAKVVEEVEVVAAVAAAVKAAKPEVAEATDIGDIDLDNLSFDD